METSTKITQNEQLVFDIISRGVITEKEINLIMRRMNSGQSVDLSDIWNNPVRLTSEQNQKGLAYLLNLWKTPKGVERKNNPFGYREEDALETFEYFEFAGTYDIGNRNFSHHVPLYNVVGKETGFQYHMKNGEINIVG